MKVREYFDLLRELYREQKIESLIIDESILKGRESFLEKFDFDIVKIEEVDSEELDLKKVRKRIEEYEVELSFYVEDRELSEEELRELEKYLEAEDRETLEYLREEFDENEYEEELKAEALGRDIRARGECSRGTIYFEFE